MPTTSGYFTNPVLDGFLERTDVVVYDLNLIADDELGAFDLINYISNETYKPLALAATATPQVTEKALGENGLGVLHLFDFISYADPNPTPEFESKIYQKMKEYFGKNQSYLAFVATESGVNAAHAAGMACIVVSNQFTLRQNFLDAVLVISDQSRNATIERGPVKPDQGASKKAEGFPQP